MDPWLKDWIDVLTKIIGGVIVAVSVLIATFNYRKQVRIKRAEWLKSLFEKFFENQFYKEVRGWLDYGEVADKLADFGQKRVNEEKFTDFLNFFEFIGVLYDRKELKLEEIRDVFDYYLKIIKRNNECTLWIEKYGFEKLQNLLSKLG